jgi:hypothetical protein
MHSQLFSPARSFSLLLSAALTILVTAPESEAQTTRVPVVFSEGHDTDPRDRGRPVVLVAGALGVEPQVFRDAFSGVHPAGPNSGGPTHEEARANKKVLMDALGKYGITNDRLDTVSNRYRYVRSRNEMWPVKPAVAVAIVKDGVVTGYEVTDGGYGYSSAPVVTVPGVKAAPAEAQLKFDKDFEKNGSVTAIKVEVARAK